MYLFRNYIFVQQNLYLYVLYEYSNYWVLYSMSIGMTCDIQYCYYIIIIMIKIKKAPKEKKGKMLS